MRRFLAIQLPELPFERLRLTPPEAERPLALVENGAKGAVLTAADATARRGGLRPGMPLADARAVAPHLAAQPAEPERDAALLARLAEWVTRWTPWAAVSGVDGLMLDMTGCAHLWDGEAELVGDVAARFERAGFRARLGLAGTQGAAWAVARFAGAEATIVAEGDDRTALLDYPVEALRLDPDQARTLRDFGLKTVGRVAEQPRAGLARRFSRPEDGEAVLTRLDQAFGWCDEPLGPGAPAPERRAVVAPPEPLLDAAGLTAGLGRALDRLLPELEAADLGATRLGLTAFRADGGVARLAAGFARPTRERAHIARLFADRIPGIDPGFGVDALALAAEATAPLAHVQVPLDPAAPEAEGDLARLVDRLANRLGPEAVQRLRPVESWLPERAEAHAPPLGRGETWTPTPGALDRPLRRFERPEPIAVSAAIPDGPPLTFRWRRVLRHVARAEGPERIAPEWWRAPSDARTRDYYTVEDTDGRRYWLCREGCPDDPATPRWTLWGLFP